MKYDSFSKYQIGKLLWFDCFGKVEVSDFLEKSSSFLENYDFLIPFLGVPS